MWVMDQPYLCILVYHHRRHHWHGDVGAGPQKKTMQSQSISLSAAAIEHGSDLKWVLVTLGIYVAMLVAYSLAGWLKHEKFARGSFVVRLGIELAALSGIARIAYKIATGFYETVFGMEDYLILGIGLVASAFLLIRHIVLIMSKPFRAIRGQWDPKTE